MTLRTNSKRKQCLNRAEGAIAKQRMVHAWICVLRAGSNDAEGGR